MIFFIGVILIIVGIGMLFIFIKNSLNPKTDARIEGIEFKKIADNPVDKSFPHARVSYMVRNQQYENEILLKVNAPVGSNIQISYKESDPNKINLWAPAKELGVIGVLIAIGGGLIGLSYFLVDKLENW